MPAYRLDIATTTVIALPSPFFTLLADVGPASTFELAMALPPRSAVSVPNAIRIHTIGRLVQRLLVRISDLRLNIDRRLVCGHCKRPVNPS
jgi:hypothetical protein